MSSKIMLEDLSIITPFLDYIILFIHYKSDTFRYTFNIS